MPPISPVHIHSRVMIGVIVAAVVLAFGRLCGYDFISWDDEAFIARNPLITDLTWQNVGYYWHHAHETIYIPLTTNVWQLLAWAGRSDLPNAAGYIINPHLFHAANVLIHAVTSVLAFVTLRRLLRSDWAAWAGALLFALHPVQVETVAWVSGTKDLMAGAFTLLAIALYVASGDEADARRRRRLYLISTAVFVLAMLSKPSAFTTPAVLLAIDLLLKRTPWREASVRLAPWFALSLIFAVIARASQPVLTDMSDLGYTTSTPLLQRPLIVGHTLAFYLGQVVWPAKLAMDYGHLPEHVLASSWSNWAWIVPTTALAAAAACYRRSPIALTAVLIFILAPFHVLGWVPFDYQLFSTTADHYLYVAMFGPALLAGWLFTLTPFRVGIVLTAVTVVGLGVRSWVQAGYWQNSQTIYEHTLTVNPDSWLHLNSLAKMAVDRNDWPTVADLSRRAVRAQPQYIPPYFKLGTALARLGDYPGALEAYRGAVLLQPNNPSVLTYIGGVQASLGDYLEAEKNLRTALKYDPNHPDALLNYGTLLHKRGDAASAEPFLRKAVQISPNHARARMNLASCLIDLGRRDEAVEQLQVAYTLQPGNPALIQALSDLKSQPSTTMPAAQQ